MPAVSEGCDAVTAEGDTTSSVPASVHCDRRSNSVVSSAQLPTPYRSAAHRVISHKVSK